MSDALDAFLSSYSREAREIALCLRELVLNVFPSAEEKINPKSGMITYGFRRNSQLIAVCAIAPRLKHVSLFFSEGAQLHDTSKLLSGTGKDARHIKTRSEVETENPALRQLLEEAIKLARSLRLRSESKCF